MTPIVLDASIALAWCFADEASAYAEAVLAALAEREALVPAIWPLEIANALAVAERQKRIRQPDVSRYLELLNGLAIQQDALSVSESVGNVLPLARAYRLSAYDAAYLDAAIRNDAPLATLDRSLADAGRRAGAEIFPGPRR
ncbi:MAG TPA: type II toxin-antitoxin system VapC family toxin [Terriglobales bacterium]|nr:type II toxin-antitoxin system VapC family toxin [Terriglobales bacterium]